MISSSNLEYSNLQQVHDPKQNLQKINLYMNNADKSFPLIKQKTSGTELAQQMKLFFQDDDLVIAYQQTSILHENYFSDKIQQLYKMFISQTSSSLQRSFIDFIEFWILKDQKLKIFYWPYGKAVQDIAKEISKNYLSQTITKTAKTVAIAQQNQQRQKRQKIKKSNIQKSTPYRQQSVTIEVKSQINKIKKKQKNQNYNINTIKQHVHIIHDHYSKKCLNVPKALSFDNLNEIFHTMNLTQFMSFIKQVGLLNYKINNNKQSSTHNQTFSQNQLKKSKCLSKTSKRQNNKKFHQQYKLNLSNRYQKLNINFYKSMFQKHSKQFALTKQQFFDVIIEILKFVHEKQIIESPEYFQIFHLSNEQQYKEYAKSIGIYFPLYDITFIKSGQAGYNLPKIKKVNLNSKDNYNTINDVSVSRYVFSGKNNRCKSIAKENSIKKSMTFKSREQKKQYQLLDKMSLDNLKKFKLSQKQQNIFLQYIGQRQSNNTDKYSEAMNKQSTLVKKSIYKVKNEHTFVNRNNSGLIDRIDNRMNNMINKIR